MKPWMHLFRRTLRPCYFLTVVFAVILANSLSAQTENPPVGVAVKVWARGQVYFEEGDSGGFSLSGYFLSATPGSPNEWTSSPSNSTSESGATLTAILGSQEYVRVEPGKSYTLTINGSNFYGGELNIVAPPGYRVVMDSMSRSRDWVDGSDSVIFEIEPMGGRHAGLAGLSSGMSTTEVDWRVSLGALRNGGSAGDLSLIDVGLQADWAGIAKPGSLTYEPPSSEISVHRTNNVIRQISANQVFVDVLPLPNESNPTHFEIRCYHPSQASGSFPRSLTGSPFITYRVEKGATATSLKVTKEVRNVTSATNFPIARTEYLFLKRTGTYPTCTWTRTDWSTSSDPATAPSETEVASVGSNAARTETISVRVPTSGPTPNNPVAMLKRDYEAPLHGGVSTIGAALKKETLGPGTGPETLFTYHADPTDFGSLGHIKDVTLPGGSWTAFQYYPTNIAAGYRGGRVKYRFRPYLNDPMVATQVAGQGEETYYEYVNDVFGAPTRTSLVRTTVGTTVTAKTTTLYNDSQLTANTLAVGQSTVTNFSSDGQGLATVVRYYREDLGDAFARGQTYSTTSPDNIRQSFIYHRGTYNANGTFTPGNGGSGIGSGTASRVIVITGSTYLSGTVVSLVDGYALDPVNPVEGKSTKEVTIRDSRALVVRTESHIWKQETWQRVAFTDFTYDYAGRLTTRIASNGATYTALYDGGLKTSETDEAGVVTNYTYDAAGRVAVATRVGSGVIGPVETRFTYDAAGRLTEEKVATVGAGSTAETLTSTRTYDDAGRLHIETPVVGLGAVTHTYDTGARKHTATRADGTASTTENYRDGRLKSRTGSAVVPEFHTYGVATFTSGTRTLAGARWHQVNTGIDPALTSPRWQKSWTDWLGRTLSTARPGFTGQVDIVTENFYDQLALPVVSAPGRLLKTTQTGYAPTFYHYNALGQVTRSGLDLGEGAGLTLASGDRITDSDTFLEFYSGTWWMRSDTRTYPKLNDATATLTATSRTRLTGHPANRLSETQSVDAEGNVTTQTVDVNRIAKTSTARTTRSGIAGAMVEQSLNGFSTSVQGFDGLTTLKTYDALLRPLSVTDSRNNTVTNAYRVGTKLVETVTSPGAAVGTTTSVSAFFYDSLGRLVIQRDARNHYTRMAYNNRGQIIQQWGDGTMPVSYGYDDTYGERTTMRTYRGGSGWDTRTGDFSNAANPWPTASANASGAADLTTWVYDPLSGLPTAKISPAADPASTDPALSEPKSVLHTYNLRGQTHTRSWARLKAGTTDRVTTTYGYDAATGELLTQTYNDGTPAVAYTYGRSGQVETVADFTTQSSPTVLRDFVYDPTRPWRLSAEAHGSFYGSRVITRLYEEAGSIGRVRGFQVGGAVGSATDLEQTFGFTTVGRFETLATKSGWGIPARTFRYTYRADSALIESLGLDQGAGPGGHPFTVTRGYETRRDLVTSLTTKWGSNPGNTRVGYNYAYDERGQRTSVVQEGDAFADYGASTFRLFGYNGKGELTGDVGYLGSTVTDQSKPLPGRHHGFAYDHAGNRKWSDRTGIDILGNDGLPDLRDEYTTNALNQYQTRENNTVALSGTADPGPNSPTTLAAGDTAVSVARGAGDPVRASRQGRYWNAEVAVKNDYGPVPAPANPDAANPNPWRGPLTIFTAKRGATASTDVYRADSRMAEIAAGLQKFNYDADGNLTSDGVNDYKYDAENRLVQMETTSLARTWLFPHRLLEFRYDYLGRRVQKRVVDLDQNPAVEISCRRYLYDGWNLVAEYALNAQYSTLTLVRSYTWGLDIVNSQADAGGVGALLQITDHPTGKSYLPAYDGNGNIAALLNTANGDLAACYEYSPYGEPLRAQTLDATVVDNPWRFSTKFADLETGLVYYGHRFYDPRNGRFINKDPIEEAGGLNLYGFCGNNAINHWDLLGHEWNVAQNSDGNFTATAMDPWGNIGSWNFESKADADRWGQAWVNHNMSIVGDRGLTKAYIDSADPILMEELGARNLTLEDITSVDGLNLAHLPSAVWWGRTIPSSIRNTELGQVALLDYLHNPREWLESFASGYSWIDEAMADMTATMAFIEQQLLESDIRMKALWARVASGTPVNTYLGGSASVTGRQGSGSFQATGDPVWVVNQGNRGWMQPGILTLANGLQVNASRNVGSDMRWNFNCHGYALFGGNVWIQDADMQAFMVGQARLSTPMYTQANSASVGDIVVYSVGGSVVHSAVVTASGQVTMANGTQIYSGNSKTTTVSIEKGWSAPGATYSIWTPTPKT